MRIIWLLDQWHWQFAALGCALAIFSFLRLGSSKPKALSTLSLFPLLFASSFLLGVPTFKPQGLESHLFKDFLHFSDMPAMLVGFGLYFFAAFLILVWAPFSYFRRKRLLWRTLGLLSLLLLPMFGFSIPALHTDARLTTLARLASANPHIVVRCQPVGSLRHFEPEKKWVDNLYGSFEEAKMDAPSCAAVRAADSPVPEIDVAILSHHLAHLSDIQPESRISCTGAHAQADVERILGISTVPGELPEDLVCAPGSEPDANLLSRLASYQR